MSADLYAEFGSGSATAPVPRSNASPNPGFQTGSLIADLDSNDEILASVSPENTTHRSLSRDASASGLRNEKTGQRSTIEGWAFRSNAEQEGQSSTVLYDATLQDLPEDGVDDWGEFESPETESGLDQNQPTATNETSTSHISLGHIGQNHSFLDVQTQTELISIDDNELLRVQSSILTGPDVSKGSAQTTIRVGGDISAPSTTAEVVETWDNDWGDFVSESSESTPARQGSSRARVRASSPRVGHQKVAAEAPTITRPVTGRSDNVHIRPTNIPPPSLLLQLAIQVFDRLEREISNANTTGTPGIAIASLAERTAYTLKVAARLVAGRMLRWRRDSILSQSMKLGPARSGKPGGMKLNALNKTENVKEQQEVHEVLQNWREKAGLFNSVLVSSGQHPIQPIPEQIRAVPAQGALKASHACALCGLNRDERLPKIDDSVEDSFGDWWTDYWGHADCRKVWEENRHLLGQR